MPDAEENMLRSRASSARWCARASSAACTSEIDDDVDRFFATLLPTTCTATARRSFPKRYFELLQAKFGDDCEVLTVIDTSGTPVSQRAELLFPRRGAALLRRRHRRGARARRPTTSSTGS